MKVLLPYIIAIVIFASCSNDKNKHNKDQADITPVEMTYSIIAKYPHDTAAFTEGLLIHNGQLYESTGGQQRYDTFKSWFASIDLSSGKAIKKVMLDTSYFGEGISILNGNLYQLTYRNEIGFVYDTSTFKKIKEFKYNGEGWALTTDGTYLIMSNGGSNLQYINPLTLAVEKVVTIRDNNGPVSNINELELINGYLYANQYLTNYILKIDLVSGDVIGKIDCSKIVDEAKQKYAGSLELNGIAYDSLTQKIYITGKAWPYIYQVKF